MAGQPTRSRAYTSDSFRALTSIVERTVTLTKRYSIILASLNAWTPAGGGLLIALGGNPFLGPLLVVAGLVILGMAVTGRLRLRRTLTLSQSLLSMIGIQIMFFGLLFLGGEGCTPFIGQF